MESGAWGPVLEHNHTHSALRYQGHVGASLVVGGLDVTGPQLYSVHPHGSYSRLPFAALGKRFCRVPTNPAPTTLASRLLGQPQLILNAPPVCRLWPGCSFGGAGGPVPAEHDGERHLPPTYMVLSRNCTQKLGEGRGTLD